MDLIKTYKIENEVPQELINVVSEYNESVILDLNDYFNNSHLTAVVKEINGRKYIEWRYVTDGDEYRESKIIGAKLQSVSDGIVREAIVKLDVRDWLDIILNTVIAYKNL